MWYIVVDVCSVSRPNVLRYDNKNKTGVKYNVHVGICKCDSVFILRELITDTSHLLRPALKNTDIRNNTYKTKKTIIK